MHVSVPVLTTPSMTTSCVSERVLLQNVQVLQARPLWNHRQGNWLGSLSWGPPFQQRQGLQLLARPSRATTSSQDSHVYGGRSLNADASIFAP
eukprot:jgi/Botrbrau1/19683/Bobra.0003s0045.1